MRLRRVYGKLGIWKTAHRWKGKSQSSRNDQNIGIKCKFFLKEIADKTLANISKGKTPVYKSGLIVNLL